MNDPYRYRDDNLRVLGFESYGAYLRSELWADIRARALAANTTGKCVKCGRKLATQVHHRSYDPATLRGDILGSLSCLCGRCHLRAERPQDMWQSPYDRFKSAGEFMLRRKHPREMFLKKARKGYRWLKLIKKPISSK